MIKILFIRLSSLGDVVLTESTVRFLKSIFNGIEIHYLTKSEYAQMVNHCFVLETNLSISNELDMQNEDANISFPLIHKVHVWDDKINLLRALRKEKFDFVIDLQNKFNTFLIKLFCRAKKNITYNKQHLLRRLIIKKISLKQIDSVVSNYINTIDILINSHKWKTITQNIPLQLPNLSFPVSSLYYPKLNVCKHTLLTVKEKFMNYNIPADRYLIGIFPGASHFTKQCPLAKFANFISEVPDYWKCSFLIFGSWNEKLLFLNLKSLTNTKLYDLVGAFDITELIASISLLDLVITNDSGPMHIAAALKKPQIILYGATHTRLGFRPLNEKAVVLQKNIHCQPCSLHGGKTCKKNTLECFRNITSSELFDVFQKMFEENVLLDEK